MSVNDFTSQDLPRFTEELFDFLRIPSISARSEHRGDVRHAAEWVADNARAAGLTAEIIETPGHPVVLAEWREAGPSRPTVLVYGHYDVQPAEPLELWTTPPFEPEEREGRIYARGSADDKGQLFLHLKALEVALRDGGQLPVNVILVAEGEEEIGSPNLVPFVEAHRERLAADVVVVSDSAMFAPGLPSLLFSLRGLVYAELRVRGASSDLHSGSYGGAIPNPATALARILATMHHPDGRIAIEGFYDHVVEWDDSIISGIRALPFDPGEFRDSVQAPDLAGEAGFSTLERLWTRPTCEINGLLSGYTGEGAKTVLPAEAMAKVSFRLVPDQDPGRIIELVRAHVAKVAPPEIEFEIEELQGGKPWRGPTSGPLLDAASRALEDAFGTPPVMIGEGGSIPIVCEFERILSAPALLMGFALPGANMHAPDEWFPSEHIAKGIHAIGRFYEEYGRA
jgi:acetylornithine deacetylase/succinyl-diaminopimelate desuccinylase-like protein